MKYLVLLMLLFIVGCPNCPANDPEETPGLHSKELGKVSIGTENCTIIETYELHNCDYDKGNWDRHRHERCWGEVYQCDKKVLTRITKCPSGNHTNSIGRTGGKYPHETVE